MAYDSPWQDPNQQYPGGALSSGWNGQSSVGYDPSSGDNWGTPDYTEQVNVSAPRVTSDPGSSYWDSQGTQNTYYPSNNGYDSTANQGGSNGFDWQQWLTGGNGSAQLGALPLAGMAMQQWNNSDRYRDAGDTAAQMADPFSSQRGQYQTKLWDIYNDPSKVLADPQHQAIMDSQLNKIQARNRAGGYMGSGKDFTDMADYSAQENAKYLNDEKARLAQLSGAQFDPGNAAAMWMKAQENAMGSENAALGALGMAYQNAMGNPSATQNRPGVQSYGTPSTQGLIQQGADAGGDYIQKLVSQGAGRGGANPGGLVGGLGGMNFGQGSPFAPDLNSPYWSQFTPGNYNADNIAQQELGVTAGNTGPGNTGYDQFGGQIDQWGNPAGTDYGGMGPFQDSGMFDQGGYDFSQDFDPLSWWSD